MRPKSNLGTEKLRLRHLRASTLNVRSFEQATTAQGRKVEFVRQRSGH